MAINTHCLPSGSLGTNEIAVTSVDSSNVSASIPAGGLGNGNIRGVVVFMTGLPIGIFTISGGISVPTAPSFANTVVTDGWISLAVTYPEELVPGIGAKAIYDDVNSDTGNGSRYLKMTLHWWDHVVEYIYSTYGQGIPILIWGGSWGGYHTLQIAANKTSTIVGYYAMIPATILSNANPAYTNPVNYSTLPNGTVGLDTSTTLLNSVNVPGAIMYGTQDIAVGWAYPTFGTLANSTESADYVAKGYPSSNTDQIIINAQTAGAPLLRVQTPDFHNAANDDFGISAVYSSAGPTALSGITTLPMTVQALSGFLVTTASISSFRSGEIAIYASDNLWHTITFTPFSWYNYCTDTVTNVATSLPSTLHLGSTTGLYLTSGTNYVSIHTTGTQCIASYTGVSGNTLTGVTYISGTGNITGLADGITTLITYCSTNVANVTSLPSTLTLNTTHGLATSGGTLTIHTNAFGGTLTMTYTGVSGSTITGCTYVSGSGAIVGDNSSTVTQVNNITGCSFSGNTSATVSLNSPIAMTGMSIGSNAYYKMALPWWISNYINSSCPRKY